MDAIREAHSMWWRGLSRVGDPMRRTNIVTEAFEAGWRAALAQPVPTPPWASVKAVPYSSIVGGGTMLLDDVGRCVGQVMLLNVEPDRRQEFEAAISRLLGGEPS